MPNPAPDSLLEANPDQARKAVQEVKSQYADFVKILRPSTFLNPNELLRASHS